LLIISLLTTLSLAGGKKPFEGFDDVYLREVYYKISNDGNLKEDGFLDDLIDPAKKVRGS